jgi:hypothetical protein
MLLHTEDLLARELQRSLEAPDLAFHVHDITARGHIVSRR